MLNSDTRRRIDSARDILVGKLPDPKAQIDQITTALIYKFMSDMDYTSETMGGKASFFVNDFKQYSWENLMSPKLGGNARWALYSEAISKLPHNPHLPQLFRDIFKNAFLPYRDTETLNLFLKEISWFTYTDSESLGDAFEYLLSIMGSQGDAGQFRTPRHIIDFIVEVVDPQKGDTILDPACGTAGFLISAYKHILKQNTGEKTGDLLSPDDKENLMSQVVGYDISPDMVKLSLVNMYLHGFPNPNIHEYDTLYREDRWNEYYDIIMANPPFMSPKGGIRPHKRFSVQANRSEVLFVDYIAEHLNANGRAGVIVPEGIIFQSANAYQGLRKMLVENYLVAVVSLPAGVFNPYSSVKTSILILDKLLSKKTHTIAFFGVENDGFGLGAQRREIINNDLPQVKADLGEYLRLLRAGESVDNFRPSLGLIVEKGKIAANGEFQLSGDRYREGIEVSASFPLVLLGDVCDVSKGSPITREEVAYGSIPVIAGGQTPSCFHNVSNRTGETITVSSSGAYAGFVAYFDEPIFASDCSTIKPRDTRLLSKFLFHLLKSKQNDIYKLQVGMGQPHVYSKDLVKIKIPVPPLEIQKAIVANIEDYQTVIAGANSIIKNYRPNIYIQPNWPIIELREICSLKNGINFTKDLSGYTVKIIGVGDFKNNLYAPLADLDEVHLDAQLSEEYLVKAGDILFVRSNGNVDLVGRSVIVPATRELTTFSGFTIRARFEDERVLPLFYAHFFKSRDFAKMIKTVGRGANIRNLSQGILNALKVPLPPLALQKSIVAEIEAEQKLVDGNRELINRFEKKILDTITRVWGEAKSAITET